MDIKVTKIQLRLSRETLTTLSDERAQDVVAGQITDPTWYHTCQYCPTHGTLACPW